MTEYYSAPGGLTRIEQYLTPDSEEQLKLVLEGKCPHHKGWTYEGPHHNDHAYKCRLCGEIDFY